MSTFNGIVHEFPDIRIDFFRNSNTRPPLACFLSHVHSDHLAGLDKLRSPFVYCSAATREMLLRLEKYHCRLNYAKGVLEDPRMQTYKHLAKLLKPIPLDTPTKIELEPGNTIQVTLLDANHCAGSVMFLIEGINKAILYTGDIRSEPWWVNSIARNPSIIEYSTGIKTLDCIYLDTSILDNFPLQTKAEGLHELLEQVARYPKDTIFYMQAWTYGYEEVWVALSKALNSKIHVDKYKLGVYKSLATKTKDDHFTAQTYLTKDAPYLVGFTCGNNQHEGCLTLDENVRIHSCEKGMGCSVMENKPVVFIKPIVAHLKDGQDMVEVGIGGGGDDLTHKLSLDADDIRALLELIETNSKAPSKLKTDIKDILHKALVVSRSIDLDIEPSESTEQLPVADIIKSLANKANMTRNPIEEVGESDGPSTLPWRIVFPYARHSSLPELRHFVNTFKPKDIWPCTVDLTTWAERWFTIESLFGDVCAGNVFMHDHQFKDQILEARLKLQEQREGGETKPETKATKTSEAIDTPRPAAPPITAVECIEPNGERRIGVPVPGPMDRELPRILRPRCPDPIQGDPFQGHEILDTRFDDEDELSLQDSQASVISDRAYEARQHAFYAAMANMEGKGPWRSIHLISTTDNHSTIEPELGGL
ncbi:Metallo-hydrolase/oxidoreductase [Hypomontagnella monticulosa]|nr:Metallo-hydrolase/oxidoreductase [Hypomontagnella monticulosa]